MPLKDLLTAAEKPIARRWIDEMKDNLTPEDYEWLWVCIRDTKNFSGGRIATVMTKLGYPVSATTINDIRRKLRD